MEIQLVTSDADFSMLLEDWNRLCGDLPLLRHEWLYSWWKQFGRKHKLAIVTVRVDDRIVAIAPWYVAHDPLLGRVVRFLGSGKACTDYQRILSEPEWQQSAVEQVAKYLAFPFEPSPFATVDRVELEGVASTEPTVNLLVDHLQRHGFAIQRESLESSWAISDVADWETYAKSLSKRMRRKLRKSLTRIEQTENLQFYRTSGCRELVRKWPTFVELHQKRFRDTKGLGGCFACHDFTMFLLNACKQLSVHGMASIYWAELDGRPLVAQLHLQTSNTTYMYQSGFDDAFAHLEPGFLLYSHAMRQIFGSGTARSLDFLRGNEKYKSMWNAREIPLWRINCISPRWTSRIRQQAYLTGRKIKQMATQRFSPQAVPAHANGLDADR